MFFDKASREKITRVCGIGVTAFVLALSYNDHADAMINEGAEHFAEAISHITEDIAREAERRAMARHACEVEIINAITELKRAGAVDIDPRIIILQRELKRMDAQDNFAEKAGEVGLGLFGDFGKAVIGDYTKERDIEKAQREALAADDFVSGDGSH